MSSCWRYYSTFKKSRNKMTFKQAQKKWDDALQVSGEGNLLEQHAAWMLFGAGEVTYKCLYMQNGGGKFRYIFSRQAWQAEQEITQLHDNSTNHLIKR